MVATEQHLWHSSTIRQRVGPGEVRAFQQPNAEACKEALAHLQQVALNNGNLFEALMDTVRVASLGQITQALYEVCGQYRRNM